MKTAKNISQKILFLMVLTLVASGFLFMPSGVYGAACVISASNPSPGQVGTPFNLILTASGGTHSQSYYTWTFTWSLTTVPGLTGPSACGDSKCSQRSYSGTPTAAGSYSLTATANDTGKARCTIGSATVVVTINPPVAGLAIDTNSLQSGQVGVAYNVPVSASGGTTPYTWSQTGLPSGLSINASTGVITGTPAAGTVGTYTVNITVTGGGTATKSFPLTIAAAAIPLDISTPSVPAGQVNIPYSYTMTGTGGTTPYGWSVTNLPPGLTMSAGGLLSGTPTTLGTYNMTVTITDSAGATANKIYAVTISAAPVVVTTNMSNYCITPPFITPENLPNLLLMIDNSASMYDLTYIDKGSATRTPYYCYDETFSSADAYPGYYAEGSIYKYNGVTYRFEVSGFPALCDKQVPSTGSAQHLCIKGTNLNNTSTPKTVTDFYASGKYLNWLTASKFDVQKKILTGGKFDAGFQSLIAESRGCVGRRFIKEALTGNYVEGGTNTSLGITFGVRGPIDPANPGAPSPGGLTQIDIFAGDYDQGTCQTAIDLYQDPSCNQLCRRNATSSCLNYSSSTTQAGKTSNVFIQTVQECYQFDQDGTVGNDAKNTVKNQCPEVLDYYSPGTCSVTTTKSCTTDAGCASETPAGQRCMVGPYAILPGSPALLCGSAYTGACYVGSAPYSKSNYTGTITDASGTYTGDDCITHMHNKFCGDIKQPPVIDPTDEPSATDFFANVPAILGDAGVQSQLGDVLKTLQVRVQNSAPEGIIHTYRNRIRIGAQSFNFAGSSSECKDTDIVKCPRICSNDPTKICLSFQDCPPASPTPTCALVTSSNMFKDPATNQFSSNLDSDLVIAYIGDPTYAANPIGDHNSGLIKALDDIRAQTWTPFAEGFYNGVAYFTQNTADTSRPYRLNSANFNTTTNPIQNSCQKNNILLITDGMSTTDQSSAVLNFVSTYNDGDGEITTAASASGSVAPKYFGSKNVDDIAWYAQQKNIFDPASTAAKKPKETIKTYVVYSGEPCASKAADGITCTSTDENIPERLMQQTASNGGGSYHLVTNPAQLMTSLDAVFTDIAGEAASGTAASVLASGEGSGANLIQAVFYPWRQFDNNTEARWIGRISNLWYYVDPRFGASGIYEDSGSTSANILDLRQDNLVTLYYDPVAKLTKAHRVKDTNNDGVADTPVVPDIKFELLSSLWDSGSKLWKRNITDTTQRRIKTTTGSGLIDLSAANKAALQPYLRATDTTEAENIIKYVHGVYPENASYRSRTVTITGSTTDAGSDTGVWRLGDVIQSTPRIATRFALNTYDQTYGDTTYKTYISPSGAYANRGLVFVGANDGMLHAFYLGKLELSGAWKDSVYKKAKLDDPDSLGRGKEMWAFVPKNVLPYLKYLADPSYCHIYSVDLTPMVFDAAIGAPADGDISNNTKDASSWRTILIGGMRLGGGCRKSDDTTCTNCVKAPGADLNNSGSVDTDAEKSVGLSSYFALDITNTLNDPTQDPQLLWEFSTEGMGLTSSGPSVVKINMKTGDTYPSGTPDGILDGRDPSDKTKNGKYFVVFASGPTGTISTSDHQFTAESSQNLKLYVLNLKTGILATSPIDTGITEAFAGNIFNTTLDTDLDYQDDVLYVPYVRYCGLADALHPCTYNTWTDGGVGRLLTHEDLDPDHWTWSEVIDGTGPVTAAVGKLLNKNAGKLWLYFGTGRYFFEQDSPSPDDPTGQRRVYAVKDPCYSTAGFASSCSSASGLRNVTNLNQVLTAAADINAMSGWYINLRGSEYGYRAERVITDPLASITGLVLFTTFQPKDDSCNPGGRSFIWAAKYNTGGAAGALLKGKGLLQVSTGSIEEVDLKSAFTRDSDAVFAPNPDPPPDPPNNPDPVYDPGEGRKTTAMEGVPPTAQGLSILATPPPVKRTIHVKER